MNNIILSDYQKEILNWVKLGYGNAVVRALAGTGKTFILKECVNIIHQNQKILMLAFNKTIAEELKKSIAKNNVHIKTIHGLGYSIIIKHFENLEIPIKIDDNKYKNQLNKNIAEYIDLETYTIEKLKLYKENVLKLCSLGRSYLCKTLIDLKKLLTVYNILTIDNELEISLKLIEWGSDYESIVKEYNEYVLDFTDMVYIPNILNLKTSFKYDFIMVDECQDMSVAQQGVFFKTFRRGARFICVGDPNQLIYLFNGSSYNSYNKLLNTPNTIELPLLISYRCSKKVCEVARTIISDFEVPEDAIEGSFNKDVSLNKIQDGDMVLCRNNQPLIKLYLKLLRLNKKCYFKNSNSISDIVNLINLNFKEDINDLYNELYKQLISLRDNISINDNISIEEANYNELVVNLFDNINVIKTIGENLNTTNELLGKIEKLFNNNELNGICLMTIHTSKGLEADNVFILNKSLLHNKERQSEEQEQEDYNLEYVAYTRAKKTLNIISENELPLSITYSDKNKYYKELITIENKIY